LRAEECWLKEKFSEFVFAALLDGEIVNEIIGFLV
jgi:hypothetical protein